MEVTEGWRFTKSVEWVLAEATPSTPEGNFLEYLLENVWPRIKIYFTPFCRMRGITTTLYCFRQREVLTQQRRRQYPLPLSHFQLRLFPHLLVIAQREKDERNTDPIFHSDWVDSCKEVPFQPTRRQPFNVSRKSKIGINSVISASCPISTSTYNSR